MPYYAELDSGGRAQGDSLLRFVAAVVADSRAKFARFPQNTVVDVHGVNHFVFLQRPTEVARAIRSFLSRQRIVRQAVPSQSVEPHVTTSQRTSATARR